MSIKQWGTSFDSDYQILQRLSAIEAQVLVLSSELSACASSGASGSKNIYELQNKVDCLIREIHDVRVEVSNNSMITNVVRWLGAAVGGTAVALLVSAFLSKGGG